MKCGRFLLKIRAALALVLCLAMVLPFAGCKADKEDGEETVTQENTASLVITDAETAIAQLAELGEESGYENALSELTEENTTQVDGDSYYRLQQNYQGIPVYGRTVVCATDEDDNVTSITGNAVDIDETLDLIPTVTQAQVEETIQAYFTNELGWLDTEELEVETISDDALCIYHSNSDGKSHLAYCLYAGWYEMVMDAHTGEMLTGNPCVHFENVCEGNLKGQETEYLNINYTEDEGYYYLIDVEQGIETVRLINKWSWLQLHYKYSSQEYVKWTTASTPDRAAVDAYVNTKNAYEFYLSVLNHKSTDGAGRADIHILMNVDLLGSDILKNNSGSRSFPEEKDPYTDILFGMVSDGNVFSVFPDIVGHEYTHGVIDFNAKLIGAGESGAITEALCDIFGELIENWSEHRIGNIEADPNWCNHIRNIKEPWESNNPWYYEDENNYWVDVNNLDDDSGGKHVNSTVISHTAYLMWNGIDGDSAKKISTDDLAKLWYRAMLMMPSDCDFSECRQLVEWAALSMEGLSDEQIHCVSEAFDAVGIMDSSYDAASVEYLLKQGGTLSVYDEDGEYYPGYTLKIEGKIGAAASEKYEYAMYYSNTVVVESGEPYPVNLAQGYYTFTVSDRYSSDVYTFTVAVARDGENAKDNIALFTSYEVPLVVEIPEETTSQNETSLEGNGMFFLTESPYDDHISLFTIKEYDVEGAVYQTERGGYSVMTALPSELDLIAQFTDDFTHSGKQTEFTVETGWDDVYGGEKLFLNISGVISAGVDNLSPYNDMQTYYYIVDGKETAYLVCESIGFSQTCVRSGTYYHKTDESSMVEATETIQIINMSDYQDQRIFKAQYYLGEESISVLLYEKVGAMGSSKMLFREAVPDDGRFADLDTTIAYIKDVLSAYGLADRVFADSSALTSYTPVCCTKVVSDPKTINVKTMDDVTIYGKLWIGSPGGSNSQSAPSHQQTTFSAGDLQGTWYSETANKAYVFTSTGSDWSVTDSGIESVAGLYTEIDLSDGDPDYGGFDIGESASLILYKPEAREYAANLLGDCLTLGNDTYTRVSTTVKSQFLGTWKKGDDFLRFDQDSYTQNIDGDFASNRSYFVLSDNLLVYFSSGKYHQVKYEITGNTLTWKGRTFTKEGE